MKNQKNNSLLNMSSFLYVLSLFYKSKEKGTALVAALGFGLLIVLLATIAIVRSGADKTNAAVNEKAVEVQSVTDIATARTLAFLAKNPKYAEYGEQVWTTSLSSGGPLLSTYTSTNTSNNANNSCGGITGITSNSSSSSVDLTQVIGKQAINSSDFTKGGFQIKSYEIKKLNGDLINETTASGYETQINLLKNNTTIAVNTPFANGILTLRSDVNPSATELNDIFTGGTVRSSHQVELTIPLIKRPPNSIPLPALWVNNQAPMGTTNQNINGNLMVSQSDCADIKLQINPTYKVFISNLVMPQMPTMPGSTTVSGVTTYPSSQTGLPTGVYYLGTLTLGSTPTVLPRSGDTADSNGIYHYIVESIDGSGNVATTITVGQKVYIYLKRNSTSSGQSTINYNCAGTAGCIIQNFRIYGYNVNSTNNGTNTTPGTICLGGGSQTQAFIFARDYNVGINGGSGTNFQGMIWAKGWSDPGPPCGSASNQIVLTQAPPANSVSDFTALGFSPENLPAKVGSISSLTRQQAN